MVSSYSRCVQPLGSVLALKLRVYPAILATIDQIAGYTLEPEKLENMKTSLKSVVFQLCLVYVPNVSH